MRTSLLTAAFFLTLSSLSFGQFGGNVGYAQGSGRLRAEQNEKAMRGLATADIPPNGSSMFVDASVLMNVKTDEYVMVFGISQDGTTVADCQQKMDATVKTFTEALKPLGIEQDDLYVDFAAQTKTYGFEVEGNVAKEKLAGFELKKNVSVHFKDKALLDKLVATAARSGIFDIIKVDYIVKDPEPIQDRLMEEAAKVIKRKVARYETLLGTKLVTPPQVYIDRSSTYFPTEMYDSYIAQETENIDRDQYRSRFLVQGARKGRTFYFNPLNADGFDRVVNPVVIEPVVQFTLYLRLKYDIEGKKDAK